MNRKYKSIFHYHLFSLQSLKKIEISVYLYPSCKVMYITLNAIIDIYFMQCLIYPYCYFYKT